LVAFLLKGPSIPNLLHPGTLLVASQMTSERTAMPGLPFLLNVLFEIRNVIAPFL
jgi:hypothetical protein